MKRTSPLTPYRGGYTLLELLLVLAILVAIAGLSWPSVNRLLEDLTVKEAVEPVRAELARTRIRALDAGVTWQFRFEPDGRKYLMVPYEFDELEADEDVQQQQLASFPRMAGELPEGMTFVAASESVLGTEQLSQEAVTGLPEGKSLSEANWSPPLLFYSDGAATDAAFDIVSEDKRFQRLTLRALTGTVTVSNIETQVKR